MKSAAVLYAVTVTLCSFVVCADHSVTDFRDFLQRVFKEMKGNWTDTRVLPDAEEDLGKGYGGWVTLKNGQLEDLNKLSRYGNCNATLTGDVAIVTTTVIFDDLRYTYDFVTDDEKFSTAVGQMYGKVTDLSGTLVVVANISRTSVVKASLQSFKLLSTTDVTTEEISHQNVTDVAGFSPYISNAIVGFIKKKVLPVVQDDVSRVLNSLVSEMHFSLSPDQSSTSTTSRTTKPLSPTTTTSPQVTGSSTVPTTSGDTSSVPAGNSSANSTAKTSDQPVTSANSQTKSSPNPANVTTNTISVNSTTSGGVASPVTTGNSSTNLSPPTSGTGHVVPSIKKFGPSPSFFSPRIQTAKSADTDIRRVTATPTTTTETAEDKWLTTNFNKFVDELLVNTGKQFSALNMTPFSMPDGVEEMFKEASGSVLFGEGRVSGLSGFSYGDKFTIQVDGHLANFFADFELTNFTFGLNFSAEDEVSSGLSGDVQGKVTSLRGQLFFLANWTDPSSNNYTFQGLKLFPKAEYVAEVRSAKTLSSSQVKELAQAAGDDLQRNMVPRLQDLLSLEVSRAVERVNVAGTGHSASTAPQACLSLLPGLLTCLVIVRSLSLLA